MLNLSAPDRFRATACFALLLLTLSGPALSQGELGRLCEVKPKLKCLDKAVIEGATIKLPLDAVAIAKDGVSICDSSFNYTTAPDMVLIMDNTGSMAKVTTLDNIPRWCLDPALEASDPGCISGDPNSLRGPALRTFLDSALVKGGKGMNAGVVTFSEFAEAKSDKLLPLDASTVEGIKASIVMTEDGQTNYTAAFRAAYDLLKSSKKPKAEQFIIFVSDGRPNLPRQSDGGPYLYKDFLDTAIVTHSIFLGKNTANFKDMQDIASATKGLFFDIDDVSKLAGILTNDIAKTLFRRATPTYSKVSNLEIPRHYEVRAEGHMVSADSGAYNLAIPGALPLGKGVNNIVIKTEYGFGGTTQDVHFKIDRTASGPFADWDLACREPAALRLYNDADQPISVLGLPYLFRDSTLRYDLTTAAEIDSVDIEIKVTSNATAQQDLELSAAGPAAKRDSTWSGSVPFHHQQTVKQLVDRQLQVDHGETVIVTYRHPYIPEDSVQVKVRIKYGPEFDKAAYFDLDGDGRIETVRIHWLEDLGELPEKLQFTIKDAAGTHEREADGGEIAFDRNTAGSEDRQGVTVTLAEPFPKGVTSVSNPDSSGRTFRQNGIPLMDGRFRVDDSVAPAIVGAEVKGPDREHPLTRVIITYSEPVKLADLAVEPVVFKRDTVTFDLTQIPIARMERMSETEWAVHLQAGASFTPVGGDSVAVNNNGETSDLAGRSPKTRVFAPVRGGAPGQSVSGFFVTFPNGSKSDVTGPAEVPFTGTGFIPVDSRGYPMPGSLDGKCGSCDAGRNGNFGGAVINVLTKQPVTWEFAIYTNLGELVSRASGKITEADFALLDKIEPVGNKDPNEVQKVQRIIWTGYSKEGQAVGTGVYVVKATFKYEKSFKTGAKAAVNTRINRFGFMRTCCQTWNTRWYD